MLFEALFGGEFNVSLSWWYLARINELLRLLSFNLSSNSLTINGILQFFLGLFKLELDIIEIQFALDTTKILDILDFFSGNSGEV